MTAILWLWRALLAAALAGLFWALTLWCGPDIEATFSPVIANQSIAYTVRDFETHELCFIWSFDKRREARAVDANWTLRSPDGVYPFQPIRRDIDSEGNTGRALVKRPVRDGLWTRYCIAVPPTLMDAPLTVSGWVEYETHTTGSLWRVRHPTATGRAP